VPGGFGKRGIEGKIVAARYAREHRVPYLGICLGMQVATIEFARHVAGLEGANSTEFDPALPHPVIALIDEWQDRDGSIQKRSASSDLGGTMRLGAQSSDVKPGTLAHQIYGPVVTERHRHRYEANVNYLERLQAGRAGDQRAHAAREADRDRRAAAGPCTPGSSACSSTPSSRARPGTATRCSPATSRRRWRTTRARRAAGLQETRRMKLCGFDVGLDRPFFLIAGPCVVESEQLQMDVAGS
jgi:hypothetical protein